MNIKISFILNKNNYDLYLWIIKKKELKFNSYWFYRFFQFLIDYKNYISVSIIFIKNNIYNLIYVISKH